MNKDNITIAERQCTVYSARSPACLLIQPSGAHENETLQNEIKHIAKLTDLPFMFAAFEIKNWNTELSPWEAAPVFGDEPFGSGAKETLDLIEKELIPKLTERYQLDRDIPVILGGYSLAGLFSLWAGYTSNRFSAAAAVSPSVWFHGWLGYIAQNLPLCDNIYLSLGRKEEKTRNKVMATVGGNIRKQYELLKENGTNTVLEINNGDHFTEPELRTAKGFAWCIKEAAGGKLKDHH